MLRRRVLAPQMAYATRRGLAAGERAALSPGLLAALESAGADPVIVARPSIPAILVRLWRPGFPVMVLGQKIFWPGALDDFSGPGDARALSILQHELQHVLEFATGDLTRLGYVFRPANWVYRYRLLADTRWSDLGAEQRASLAEHYWLAQRGMLEGGPDPEAFRRIIPWLDARAPGANSSA